ncbi:hypothetical protein L1987_59532 [Smallanthus sonchifolius]|uniref:Uncharacterized protein n=1 Tax=Smallanthus sonchifolius TaxID=185202 RepID=A0ACB9D5J2_9ASTR|nr:hypothetical protein L1987_59532 [Smallanthus sonchifolius]
MSISLEMRLNSTILKRNLAIKKRQRNEAFARAALAYEETRMGKLEEESNRLKQEAAEISKELLIDRGHLVTLLHGEIFEKCQDVKQLKEELDQVISPGEKMPFSRKSSISASSSSSLVSSIIPCQPPPELADSDVLFKKGSGFGIGDFSDDHVQSANSKQIKNVIGFSEADIKTPHQVEDITRSIKKKYQEIESKRHGNQMRAKSIKKWKIKGKRHESQMSAKSIKKMKIKSKLHGNQICAKNIKKLKIKGKRHGSQLNAKSIEKLKIEGK